MNENGLVQCQALRRSPWYSHAARAGQLVFTCGLAPVDPETGTILGGVEEQTRRVLRHLELVLEEAGTSLENVVKVTAYLADIDEFAAYNEVYAEFFPENARPPRTTVQVGRFKGEMRVEIDAIAVVP